MKVLVTGGSGFIGTNLTNRFLEEGVGFINVDIAPPKEERLKRHWKLCNILDYQQLLEIFIEYEPEFIVHLAAETDTNPKKTIDDYVVNTLGSNNVLSCIKMTQSVKRVVWTSTQFVNQRPGGPKNDEDFAPHTIYGESKAIAEEAIRKAGLDAVWTIIRPTNIWGPWHLRYPFEFWKVLAEGKYFHPGKASVMRSYGFVGNVVDQIFMILKLPSPNVHKKVFYVGDNPIDLRDWVDGFSRSLTGKKVRIVPRTFVFVLAIVGEFFRVVGLGFPITLSRYRSMTTENPADMSLTFKVLGKQKFSLNEGIEITTDWLRKQHPKLVRTKQ